MDEDSGGSTRPEEAAVDDPSMPGAADRGVSDPEKFDAADLAVDDPGDVERAAPAVVTSAEPGKSTGNGLPGARGPAKQVKAGDGDAEADDAEDAVAQDAVAQDAEADDPDLDDPEVDGVAQAEGDAPKRRRGPIATFLRETTIVVVAALVLSLIIKTFFAQAFFIPSISMEDTLQVGDRLVVNKLVPAASDIQRGDVVVFLDPGGWLSGAEAAPEQNAVQKVLTFIGILPENADEHLIKRVIGVGGDNVICCDDSGRISVNGVSIDEPYLPTGVEASTEEFDVVVPDEHLWLLGDNRSRSADSRYHEGAAGGGFVPVSNVVGRAFVTIWPLDRLTWLSTSDEAFDEVPDPG